MKKERSLMPVALITGSAKRIGAAIAETLHHAGINVVIHCHHSENEAVKLVAKLNNLRQSSAAYLNCDITDLKQLPKLATQAIQQFGRLDYLINNASTFYPTPIGSIKIEDWQSLVGTNMQAPLFLNQLLAKELTKNQGAIINMVDIHAQKPLLDHTVYCMAKAGLVTMTKSLAIELAPEVRVNAVAPGAILLPETASSDSDKLHMLKTIPMQRLGNPKDIADAILYLLKAPYVTGQIIAVDGGRSLGD